MSGVSQSLLSGIQIGSLIATALWGITSVQTAAYFSQFGSDPLSLKVAVRLPFLSLLLSLSLRWTHRILNVFNEQVGVVWYEGSLAFTPTNKLLTTDSRFCSTLYVSFGTVGLCHFTSDILGQAVKRSASVTISAIFSFIVQSIVQVSRRRPGGHGEENGI